MLPESHPLIDAATKPLADNAEQRLAANARLGEAFDPDHAAVAGALERLGKADSKRRPGMWRIALHVCAGVALCLMLVSVKSIHSGMRAIGLISSMGLDDEPKPKLPDILTPAQKLLLGEPSLPTLRQKELLHGSDPDRPDFYVEYAGAYWQEHSDLPADYMETAARLDPDNAFFLYNAAGRKGGDLVERVKSRTGSSPPPRFQNGKRLRPIPFESEWTVTDQAEFDRAMELVSRASRMPRFDSYEQSLAAARLELLPQDTMLERIRTLGFMAGQTSQIISIRKIADLFCAKAYLLSIAGDKQGFAALAGDLESFLKQFGTSPESYLVGELVFQVVAVGTATSFHFAAKRLGMADLAETYGERKAAFFAERDRRDLRDNDEEDLRLDREGSMLTGLTAPMVGRQVWDPPAITSEDLAPGRFADHDFFAAISAGLAAFLMGLIALGALLLRRMAPRSVRVLAQRFNLLLTPCDWAWILSCGVVLPVAAVVVLGRFTPAGGRGLGIQHFGFFFPPAHYALVVVLVVTVAAFLIQWRLGKRLEAFGLGRGFSKGLAIVPLLGTAMVLIAAPVLGILDPARPVLAVLAALPALWVIGLLIAAGFSAFGNPAHHLRRMACLHALAPAFSLAIVVLAALVLVLKASGERWVARDDFGRVAATGLSPFEAEVASRKRKEINAILGFGK
jgi:hypothetical protein